MQGGGPRMPTSRELVVAACTAIVGKVRHLGDCVLPLLSEMAAAAFDDASRGIEDVCHELVNELPLGDDLLRGFDGDSPDDLHRQISALRLELDDERTRAKELTNSMRLMEAAFTRRSEMCRKETAKAQTSGQAAGPDLGRYLNFILEVTDAKEPSGVDARLQEARRLLVGTREEQALMLEGGGRVAATLDVIVDLRRDKVQLEAKMGTMRKSHEELTAVLQKEIVGLRRKIREDDLALRDVRTVQRRLERRARKMGQALRQAMAERQAMLLSANLKEVEARTQRHVMAQQVASLETRLEVELRRRLGKASAADDPSNVEATHDLYLDANAKRLRNPNREMLDRLVKECEACPSDPSVTVSAARALRTRLNNQSEELALWRSVAIDATAKRQAALRQAITAEEDLGRLLASARERGVELPSDLANARLKAELQGLADGDTNYREIVRTLRSERAETTRRIYAVRRDLEGLLEGGDSAEARRLATEWARKRKENLDVPDQSNLEMELSRFEAVSGEVCNRVLDESKACRMAQRDLELVDKRLLWERQLTYRQWRVLINSLPPSVGSQIDANGVVSIRSDECTKALAQEVARWKAETHQFAMAAVQGAEKQLAAAKAAKGYTHLGTDPVDEDLLLAQAPSLLSMSRPKPPPPPPPPETASCAVQTDALPTKHASMHNLSLVKSATSSRQREVDFVDGSDDEELESTFLTAGDVVMRRTSVRGRIVEHTMTSTGIQASPPPARKTTGSIACGAGDGESDTCDVGCTARPKTTMRGTQAHSSADRGVEMGVQCSTMSISPQEDGGPDERRVLHPQWQIPQEEDARRASTSVEGRSLLISPESEAYPDVDPAYMSLSGRNEDARFPDDALSESQSLRVRSGDRGRSNPSPLSGGSPRPQSSHFSSSISPKNNERPSSKSSQSGGPSRASSGKGVMSPRGIQYRARVHSQSASVHSMHSMGVVTDAPWIVCPSCRGVVCLDEETEMEGGDGSTLPSQKRMSTSLKRPTPSHRASPIGASSSTEDRLVGVAPSVLSEGSDQAHSEGVSWVRDDQDQHQELWLRSEATSTSRLLPPLISVGVQCDLLPESQAGPPTSYLATAGVDAQLQTSLRNSPVPVISSPPEAQPANNLSGSFGLPEEGDPLPSRPGSSKGPSKRPPSSSGSKHLRPSTPKVRNLILQLGAGLIPSEDYNYSIVTLARAALGANASARLPACGSASEFTFAGAQELQYTARLLHQCAALANVLLMAASESPQGDMTALSQLPTLTYQMVCFVEASLRDMRLGEAPLPSPIPFFLCSTWGSPNIQALRPLGPLVGDSRWRSLTGKVPPRRTAEGGCIDALGAAAEMLEQLPAQLAPSEATRLRSVVASLSGQLKRLLPASQLPLVIPPRSHSTGVMDSREGGALRRPASGLSTSQISFEGLDTSRSSLPVHPGKLGRKPPLGQVSAERAQLLLRSLSPPVPMFHSSVPALRVLSPPPTTSTRLAASPNVGSPADLKAPLARAFQAQFQQL